MNRKDLTLDGLPVVDADEPMILDVVKNDVDMRRRRDPEYCALSEACKRTLGVKRVVVYRSIMYVSHDDHWVRYQLSPPAQAEVKAFDRGGGFQLGEYRVSPPIRRDQRGKHLYDWGPVTRTGRPRGERAQRQIEGVRLRSPLQSGAKEWGR